MKWRAAVQVGFGCRKELRHRRLLWLPIVVSGVILYIIAINSILHFQDVHRDRLVPIRVELPIASTSFLVDSAGCRIPALDPWDPQVRKFIFKPEPLNCAANRIPPLVASNRTSLFIVQEAVRFYAEDSSQIECCYQPLHRKLYRDEFVEDEYCFLFDEDVDVQEEFVNVLCAKNNKTVYQDFHSFVPRKPTVEARCRKTSAKRSKASVLLLGIDAVSRLNLHRQMPLTVKIFQQLGAVEMLGFNKVGDNTFPNMVALLTGLNLQQLRNNCWPTSTSFFDNCRFVWDDYRDAGFRSIYGEDAGWMSTFNYQKEGFEKQPTDYYWRPFMQLMENRIGHTRPNMYLCVGSRLTTQVFLQYTTKVAETFKEDPYYAHLWAGSLFHDFLNYPSLGDDIYVKFLLELRDSGALERTVLVLVSDHGIRWGPIRETYQGRMEERLPFLFLLFPDWFRERFPTAVANVERNARRLTTHFDLFETLQDLSRPEERLSQEAVRRRSMALAKATASPEGPPRGVSLFLPVPPDRTCDQAGLEPHWCTCHKNYPVNRDSAIISRCSEFLVKHLNKILISYHQCALLSLAEILNAQLQIPHESIGKNTGNTGVHDYLLVVRTVPGNALFEATMRHTVATDEITMAGFISRINSYGSQSACVADYHLKLYCYCTY